MPLDFYGQNLRGRSFTGLDLTGANFSHSDIRGANFTNTILREANFSYARVEGTILIQPQVQDLVVGTSEYRPSPQSNDSRADWASWLLHCIYESEFFEVHARILISA